MAKRGQTLELGQFSSQERGVAQVPQSAHYSPQEPV